MMLCATACPRTYITTHVHLYTTYNNLNGFTGLVIATKHKSTKTVSCSYSYAGYIYLLICEIKYVHVHMLILLINRLPHACV